MATWVQAGNRKLNLDRAAWIDRSEDGEVHVVFDGALTHTFRGPAADKVWTIVSASDTDPLAAKPMPTTAKAARPKRSR